MSPCKTVAATTAETKAQTTVAHESNSTDGFEIKFYPKKSLSYAS